MEKILKNGKKDRDDDITETKDVESSVGKYFFKCALCSKNSLMQSPRKRLYTEEKFILASLFSPCNTF